MREALRRTLTVPLAILVSLSASSCSSGSDPAPATGCTRAAIPATGPGDPLNYFPSEVGWSWTYRIESTGQLATMAVTGTQPIGSEIASAFTSSSQGTPTVEYVAERPSGAYVLADASVTPPFDQLYPALVIPFPVAVTPPAEQITCTSLDVGDLDGDGRPDVADLSSSLGVLSMNETVQLAAGSFADLAHVQQVVHLTARTTASGTVEVVTTQDDWFAPGVGRVLSHQAVSAGGLSDSDTLALLSFTPPQTAAAKPTAGGSLAAAPSARALTLPETALRLAAAAIRGAR